MNILQICPRIPAPPSDGGAVYVYYLSKHLAKLGHEVVMASFVSNKHEQDKEWMQRYVQLYEIDGGFKPYGLGAVIKSTLARKPITIHHRMDKKRMGQLLKKVADEYRNTFDVIFLEGIHTAEFLELTKKYFPGVTILLRQSNVEYLLLRRNGEISKNFALKQFYFDQARLMRGYEKEKMAKVDAVTAITSVDREYYLKDIPDLECYVSNAGTEIPQLDEDMSRNPKEILSISNWRWSPNFEGLKWFLREVYPDLIERIPDLTYNIIGAGLNTEFKQQFGQRGINFLGFVDDLEPYRQSAATLIAPLFSGSGMKLKIVEALASGLPVITTAIGAEGINLDDNTNYLHAENKSEFIEQIEKVISDDTLRDQISRNARKLAIDEYSWDKKAQEMVEIVKQVKKKTDK